MLLPPTPGTPRHASCRLRQRNQARRRIFPARSTARDFGEQIRIRRSVEKPAHQAIEIGARQVLRFDGRLAGAIAYARILLTASL
jgi:hypothetical protein